MVVGRQKQMNHFQEHAWVAQAVRGLDLPRNLRFRILDFHRYIQVHHDTRAYEALFRGLSPTLLLEMKLYLYADLLTSSPFFEGVAPLCRYIHLYIQIVFQDVFSEIVREVCQEVFREAFRKIGWLKKNLGKSGRFGISGSTFWSRSTGSGFGSISN